MIKTVLIVCLSLVLFSCSDKEIKLPKAAKTIVGDVKDNSTVYLFFDAKGKDTLVEVNRKNTISSTNWLFAIDKRLPLRLVIPEVIKLQAKKNSSDHKNENAENYFSYADSIGKNLAFLPFTNVKFELEKPKKGIIIFFTKDGKIFVNENIVVDNGNDELQKYVNSINTTFEEVSFCFDKNMSFDTYIKTKIFIKTVELKFVTFTECIY